MSLRTCLRFLLPVAALFAVANSPAFADELTFTITGIGNSNVFSFTLPSDPSPSYASPDFFSLNNIQVDENGTTVDDILTFYDSYYGGGIQLTTAQNTYPLETGGSQLFSGSASAPIFSAGTYTQDNYGSLGGEFQIVISDGSIAATPEPSSFLLLGTGILGAAGVLRRRIT